MFLLQINWRVFFFSPLLQHWIFYSQLFIFYFHYFILFTRSFLWLFFFYKLIPLVHMGGLGFQVGAVKLKSEKKKADTRQKIFRGASLLSMARSCVIYCLNHPSSFSLSPFFQWEGEGNKRPPSLLVSFLRFSNSHFKWCYKLNWIVTNVLIFSAFSPVIFFPDFR